MIDVSLSDTRFRTALAAICWTGNQLRHTCFKVTHQVSHTHTKMLLTNDGVRHNNFPSSWQFYMLTARLLSTGDYKSTRRCQVRRLFRPRIQAVIGHSLKLTKFNWIIPFRCATVQFLPLHNTRGSKSYGKRTWRVVVRIHAYFCGEICLESLPKYRTWWLHFSWSFSALLAYC
jgi:hypothetical protein